MHVLLIYSCIYHQYPALSVLSLKLYSLPPFLPSLCCCWLHNPCLKLIAIPVLPHLLLSVSWVGEAVKDCCWPPEEKMYNGMVVFQTRALSSFSSSTSSLTHRLAVAVLLLLFTLLPHSHASGKTQRHTPPHIISSLSAPT